MFGKKKKSVTKDEDDLEEFMVDNDLENDPELLVPFLFFSILFFGYFILLQFIVTIIVIIIITAIIFDCSFQKERISKNAS